VVPVRHGSRGRGSVFRKEGDYWTIEHRGALFRLRDLKGLHYIVRLLAQPGEALSLEDLALGERAGRPSRSASERERQRITKAIRSAVDRITQHDASLGHHLASTIRTGSRCCYAPDPTAPVAWKLR
jgi:hypothetical protein